MANDIEARGDEPDYYTCDTCYGWARFGHDTARYGVPCCDRCGKAMRLVDDQPADALRERITRIFDRVAPEWSNAELDDGDGPSSLTDKERARLKRLMAEADKKRDRNEWPDEL